MAPAFGYAADRFGRRSPMLVSMAVGPIFLLLFAMAPTFKKAFLYRFLQGASCGSMTIGKVYLADITDVTNEARVFCYVGLAMGLGVVVGPTLGGALSRGALQYPHSPFFDPNLSASARLFARFPYLLPCVLSAAVSAANVLLGCLLLEESHPQMRAQATPQPAVERLLPTREPDQPSAPALPPKLPLSASSAAPTCAALVPPACSRSTSEPAVGAQHGSTGWWCRLSLVRRTAVGTLQLVGPLSRRVSALRLARSSSQPLLAAQAASSAAPFEAEAVNPINTSDWVRQDGGHVEASSLELSRALLRRLSFATKPARQSSDRFSRTGGASERPLRPWEDAEARAHSASAAAGAVAPVTVGGQWLGAGAGPAALEQGSAASGWRAGEAVQEELALRERWRAFRSVQCVQIVFALTGNGYAEVLPVRMSASALHGGYQLCARTIGMSQAVGGLGLLVVVLVVFGRLVRAVGLRCTMQLGLFANVAVFLVPLAVDVKLGAARAAAIAAGGVPAPATAAGAVCASEGWLFAMFALAWAIRAFSLNCVRAAALPPHGPPAALHYSPPDGLTRCSGPPPPLTCLCPTRRTRARCSSQRPRCQEACSVSAWGSTRQR